MSKCMTSILDPNNMIIREVLQNPELVHNFDYFNDFNDTVKWLHHPCQPNAAKCTELIQKLTEAHGKWLGNRKNLKPGKF